MLNFFLLFTPRNDRLKINLISLQVFFGPSTAHCPVMTSLASKDKKPFGDQASASAVAETTKLPFDKKKWRQNRYSNKVKLDRWQEKREKGLKQRYFKMLKKDGRKKGAGDNANLEPLGAAATDEVGGVGGKDDERRRLGQGGHDGEEPKFNR